MGYPLTLSRAGLVLLAISTVVLGSIMPVAGMGVQERSPSEGQLDDSYLQVQSGNNSTVHHENPDTVSEDGDTQRIQQWLTGRLTDQLNQSAIQISQGQYEQGRSLIGDDYNSRLDQLVDVEGAVDGGGGDDEDESDALATAGQTQRNYSTAAAEYNDTYQQYREARAAGNETGARQYARQLGQLEQRLTTYNRTLTRTYNQIANATNTDLSTATTSIVSTTESVSAQQNEVEREVFIETTLTVQANTSTVAYDEPLTLQGQLQRANGTAIANQSAAIRIYSQTQTVQTDANGQFRLQYRPRVLPSNTSSLPVTYVPEPESPYLSDTSTIDVAVEPVTATLRVTAAPDTVQFGDRVRVTARLTYDGEPIEGIPVAGATGSYRLQPAVTGPNGTATVSGVIPATVVAGDYQATIRLGMDDRAVEAAPATIEFSVAETSTTLTLDGTAMNGTVELSGQFTTIDGDPLSGRSVQLSTPNAALGTSMTNQDGIYTLIVERSELPEATNGTVAVTASFDGEGTNLDAATTTDTVRLDSSAAANGEQINSNGAADNGLPFSWFTVIALLAVILIFAVGILWRQRTNQSDTAPQPPAISETSGQSAQEQSRSTQIDLDGCRSLLANNNPEAAIRYAYQEIRDAASSDASVQPSDTHWEFLDRCRRADFSTARTEALEALVETYEQIEFQNQVGDLDVQALVERLEAEWRK